MYKLYKFFKKPGTFDANDRQIFSIEDRYPLYAFTKEKLIKNQFKEQRDMDRFIMTKTEVSEDEYKNFANNHRNEMLEYFDYDHCVGIDDDGCATMDSVQILSTRDEKEMVECVKESGIDLENIDYKFNVYMLKKEYIKALRTLQYLYFWKYESSNRKYFEFIDNDDKEIDLENDCPDIDFDEMNVFIFLYQDLLSN